MSDAVEATEVALQKAVAFLRDDVGVPLARLIPYNAQLMLLTVFFHLRPEPSRAQADTLKRWFWTTSWSGFFAGANSTQIKQALQDMRDLASERKSLADFAGHEGMLDLGARRARPFPDKFNLLSARVRAFILWELQEFPVRQNPDGSETIAVDLLQRRDKSAF